MKSAYGSQAEACATALRFSIALDEAAIFFIGGLPHGVESGIIVPRVCPRELDMPPIDLWLAVAVAFSTAVTDAAYVLFNAAVSSRHRVRAATWSSIWYLLSAFAVISYTPSGVIPAGMVRLGNPAVLLGAMLRPNADHAPSKRNDAAALDIRMRREVVLTFEKSAR